MLSMGCSQFELIWYHRFNLFVYLMLPWFIIACCCIFHWLLIFITKLRFKLKILIESILSSFEDRITDVNYVDDRSKLRRCIFELESFGHRITDVNYVGDRRNLRRCVCKLESFGDWRNLFGARPWTGNVLRPT